MLLFSREVKNIFFFGQIEVKNINLSKKQEIRQLRQSWTKLQECQHFEQVL